MSENPDFHQTFAYNIHREEFVESGLLDALRALSALKSKGATLLRVD